MWNTVNPAEFEKETYKFEGHTFRIRKLRKFSLHYCQNCGLVNGNNSLTRWAIKKGCSWIYHSDYKVMRTNLVGV